MQNSQELLIVYRLEIGENADLLKLFICKVGLSAVCQDILLLMLYF